MIKLFVCLLFFLPASAGISQGVGIGTTTPHASAALDIRSTSRGLLIPGMTQAQRNAINDPATGLLVFQSDGTAGFYYNSGTPASPDWIALGTTTGSGWSLSGNSGTSPDTHFIGTTDDAALRFKINNVNAGHIDSASSTTAIGYGVLNAVTTGDFNTGLGYKSLHSNTTGFYNTATGVNSLGSNLTGSRNTATGISALSLNTTGSYNTATGAHALNLNTTGVDNTATGALALNLNTSGSRNTATGERSLRSNSTGNENTANGVLALTSNTSGSVNTASGYQALYRNTIGTHNTANGSTALYSNINGSGNAANGSQALYSNTSGEGNTANGSGALYLNTTGNNNTACGSYALMYNMTGNASTAVGNEAGPSIGRSPSNFTAIGYNAGKVGSNSNTVEIGNASVTWIGGMVGWSTYSDEKIKEDIKPDVPGLAFISKLRPVTYKLNIHRQNEMARINDTLQWEGKYDIESITQTGFLAQEVEQAAKACNYNFSGITPPKGNGQLYSLQYSSFVMPMVKAVQEQQAIIEKLQQQIDQLLQDVRYLRERAAQ